MFHGLTELFRMIQIEFEYKSESGIVIALILWKSQYLEKLRIYGAKLELKNTPF